MSAQSRGDAILIDILVRAARSDHFPGLHKIQGSLESARQRLESGDTARQLLDEVLLRDLQALGEARVAVARAVLEFVEAEKNRLLERKASGTITENDKRFAQEELRGMLTQLQALLPDAKGRKKSGSSG